MKLNQLKIAALAAVALAATTVTLTLKSNAQETLEPTQAAGPGGGQRFQNPPPPGQGFPTRPEQPGQPGQGRPGFGGMAGGGGAAITSDNAFLYIVQGSMVFKVNKADLRVMGSAPLMGGMEFGGRPGQPDRPGNRPPGGSDAGRSTPPPPPAK